MKVGELRKQGFKAIAGDTLTNGLPDSIKLSIGGAVAVNEGDHDELKVVDLLWRTEPCDGFIGIVDFEANCWRPYIAKSAGADNKVKFVDNETANATVKTHVESMRPIFTRAMADAGELPPVGSFVLCNSDKTGEPENLNLEEHCVVDCWEINSVLEVIAHTEILGVMLPVVKLEDQVSTILLKYIKPLETRTKKQKVIDATIAEWPVADKATLELAYDLWAQKIEQ